jgi:hypothetical protein
MRAGWWARGLRLGRCSLARIIRLLGSKNSHDRHNNRKDEHSKDHEPESERRSCHVRVPQMENRDTRSVGT